MKRFSLPKNEGKNLLKKKKKAEAETPPPISTNLDVDPQDNFDILPSAPRIAVVKTPPAGLLTVDKILAVRFNKAKEGYVYSQVETFTKQVETTLQYLENDKFEK